MTARTVLGSSVGLLVAASAVVGCGGRVDDRASGAMGGPPVVRILGAGGTGAANSAGSGVGSSHALLGGTRDAGSGSAGAAVDAGPDAAAIVDAGHDAAMTADAAHEDPIEVWVGQVEHKITSLGDNAPGAPPEHVVLALFETDGVVGGSIVFGDGPRLPKATDPNTFYPPITPTGTYQEQEFQVFELIVQPFAGQPYSLFNVHRSGTRLTFEVMAQELWKDWCELQPKTYSVSEGFCCWYSCAPAWTAGSTPEVGKDFLCLGPGNHPCECDEKSCHADLSYGWVVDLELRGDSLEGLTYLGQAATGIWGNGMKLRRVK